MPEDWRKTNVTPFSKKGKKEDTGKWRQLSLTLIPGKMTEKLILETFSMHMKDKKVTVSSQHGFSKGNSGLTHLL